MAAGARVVGLDNWRAVLMLAGILLHATSVQEVDDRLFTLIGDISNNFRMGAFFMVAGLLSTLSLAGRGDEAWLSRRMLRIGVPTAFGLLIICPFMSSLHTWRVEGGFLPHQASISWWHFWFLIALLVYAPLTILVARLERRHGMCAAIDRWATRTRVPPLAAILAIGGACYAMALAQRGLAATMGPLAGPLQDAILIFAYAPMYLTGVVLGAAPAARRWLTGSIAAPLAILIGVAVVMLAARDWTGRDPALLHELRLVTICLCPAAMAVLILRSAAAMTRVTPMMARLSDAAFTIYVLHYPIILVLDTALDPLRLNHYLSYILTIVGTTGLAYWTHVAIVRRSRIAAMLLNGQPLREPRLAVA